jgi:hypothetical protein
VSLLDRLLTFLYPPPAGEKFAGRAAPPPRAWKGALPDPVQPLVFDPALMDQRGRASRTADPAFSDEADAAAWRLARRSAMEQVLRVVGRSPWRESLVLRGGLLLQSWLPKTARESRDIDWIVTSPEAEPLLLPELLDLLAADRFTPDAVELLPREHRLSEIWAYDRVPGRRVLVPFQAAGLPPGELQLDFVFGQLLPVAPVETELAMLHGAPVRLRAVTRELALAWKILWLATDINPQGKDLYDAVLLAEDQEVALPPELLVEVLRSAGAENTVLADAVSADWDVDWPNFRLEYPAVVGSPREWVDRLAGALGPTLHRALALERER